MQFEIFLYLCLLGTVCLLVSVEGTVNGDLRLVNGGSYYGRVEIYFDGEWGTVCDDSWDLNDANVVCRQLELGPAVSAYNRAYFGEGVGPIFLDDALCYGYEQRLDQCSAGSLHNCRHTEDAGVKCSSFSTTTIYNWPVYGSVRLRGGLSPYEGRVEIYYNGAWGTVCDDGWDVDDANVVCRQLGYSAAIDAPGSAYFGEGDGNILLDDVRCVGYEATLLECRKNVASNQYCSPSEDAGVVCSKDFGKRMSEVAIGGIILAVLIVTVIVVTCIVIVNVLNKQHRRSTPNGVILSGSNNVVVGVQTASTTTPPTTCEPLQGQTNMNDAAPPSYNEAVLNHAEGPQGVTMQSNVCAATYSYQPSPNTTFPDISPQNVAHPPPNANPITSENYDFQTRQAQQHSELLYTSDQNIKVMCAQDDQLP